MGGGCLSHYSSPQKELLSIQAVSHELGRGQTRAGGEHLHDVGVIDPADVQTELEQLEQGMVDNLEMKDAIKWLYMRYRGKCIGEEYDKIKRASEVYSTPEESMRVAQERALVSINDRLEIALMRGDQEEADCSLVKIAPYTM